MSRRPAPPRGAAAPMDATAPDGSVIELREMARAISARYRAEFLDGEERYGDACHAWCVHDNQYLLHWAFLDAQGLTKLDDQVAWLARVLAARDFPLDRLARNLELVADAVLEINEPWNHDVASRLLAAKEAIA